MLSPMIIMAKKRVTSTAKKAAKKAAKKSTKKVAKKATKKAAKKAAKKVASSATSLTSSASFGEELMAGLKKINAVKKSRAVHAILGGDLDLPLLPVDSFLFQQAVGMRGIPAQCVFEIIADQGVGKSTLLGHLIGGWARAGHPSAYFECEGKPPTSEWFQRLASRDKKEAKIINNNMTIFSPRSLPAFAEGLKIWAKAVREHTSVSKDKSLVAIVDPWSKLMSQKEAEGVDDFGKSEEKFKKEKEQEIATGSNQGHAKWAHEWMRKIAKFMEDYNITIIVVKHQNQEGVMNAQASMYSKATENDTSLGGNAIGQNAAIRLIGVPGGSWVNYKKERLGTYTRWAVNKCSFGHPGKEFKTRVRSNVSHWRDTETHYDVCFDWSEGLANWMAEEGHFGTRVDKKRYTCETLGVYNGTEEEFEERFYAPENANFVEHLGFSLGIYGYIDIQAKLEREKEKEARAKAKEAEQAEKEQEAEEKRQESEVIIGRVPEATPDEPAADKPNVSGSFGPPAVEA